MVKKKKRQKEKVKKLYAVTKYVMATSVREAMQKEFLVAPDDVFVDPDWKKNNL